MRGTGGTPVLPLGRGASRKGLTGHALLGGAWKIGEIG
ncbi:MAG: hypothetical protein ACJAVK_001936, partial [Akkermansiaceae bacterium]